MRAGDVELNEDVMGVVLQFVGMWDVGDVRRTCRQLRDVASRVAWRDTGDRLVYEDEDPRNEGGRVSVSQLARWHACFPHAAAARVMDAADEDLQWLRGVPDMPAVRDVDL
jgi:hypothetical protein